MVFLFMSMFMFSLIHHIQLIVPILLNARFWTILETVYLIWTMLGNLQQPRQWRFQRYPIKTNLSNISTRYKQETTISLIFETPCISRSSGFHRMKIDQFWQSFTLEATVSPQTGWELLVPPLSTHSHLTKYLIYIDFNYQC